jgi:hypothetical protein
MQENKGKSADVIIIGGGILAPGFRRGDGVETFHEIINVPLSRVNPPSVSLTLGLR